MRVLIVDDDANTLRMMSRLLKSRGHDVEICEGPFGASVRALRATPDLILIDVVMPGLDGPGLADALDRIDLTPRPRMVLWSSGDDETLARIAEETRLPVLSKRRSIIETLDELERVASTAAPARPASIS